MSKYEEGLLDYKNIWTPNEIKGSILAWYDFSDLTTLSLLNNKIVSVYDKGPNNITLEQTTLLNQPLFNNSYINNKFASNFSDINTSYLQSSNFSYNLATGTSSTLNKILDGGISAVYIIYPHFSTLNINNNNNYAYFIYAIGDTNGTPSTDVSDKFINPGSGGTDFRYDSNNRSLSGSISNEYKNTPIIYSTCSYITINSNNFKLNLNIKERGNIKTFELNRALTLINVSDLRINLGSRYPFMISPFNGLIGEIIFLYRQYQNELNNVSLVEGYLSNKWKSNLVNTHPYYNNPPTVPIKYYGYKNRKKYWTPKEIENKILAWYDFSEISTLSILNGLVNKVYDKGNNNLDLEQTTLNKQMFYDDFINNKYSIKNDRTKYLVSDKTFNYITSTGETLTDTIINGCISYVYVIKYGMSTLDPNLNIYNYISYNMLSINQDSFSAIVEISDIIISSINNNNIHRRFDSNNYNVQYGYSDNGMEYKNIPIINSAISRIIKNTSQNRYDKILDLKTNGKLLNTSSNKILNVINSNIRICLGIRYPYEMSHSLGNYGEIIILYNNKESELSDIEIVEGYLSNKWKINLDINHPYYNKPPTIY